MSPPDWSVVSLVTFITLARFGQGLFISIAGPTLLYLAENTNSDVSQVSAMFSGRAGGILVGSFLFSLIMNKFPNHKPLLSLGLILSINGVVMLVTPWCTQLWSLVIVTTIGGISFGYDDSGLQAIYLNLFGEKRSRPYIQSIHFGYSVGALLAPVIAKPFLEKAGEESDSDPTCPQDVAIETTTLVSYPNASSTESIDNNNINPIAWPFVIIGVYILITSAALCVLSRLGVEDKLKTGAGKTSEDRPEEPLRSIYGFFLIVVLMFYFLETMEVVYHSFIYSIARCSGIHFSVSQSSTLNSVFWAGFCVGRAVAIIHSKYIKPRTILMVDITCTTLGMIIMVIWGESVEGVMWTITCLYGFFVSTLYSSGISWTSQITNVSGSYIFIFTLGNAVAGMIMLPVAGVIFENDPFNVMFMLLGSCILTGLFFLVALQMARKRLSLQRNEIANETKFTNKAFEEDNFTKL